MPVPHQRIFLFYAPVTLFGPIYQILILLSALAVYTEIFLIIIVDLQKKKKFVSSKIYTSTFLC
ncbi:hypothetical protein HanIR_Chr01g0050951 [Helianthus annuus]|nr:hypothetical protein HanIR_Chr01g0050951 [Helianthus annuus]